MRSKPIRMLLPVLFFAMFLIPCPGHSSVCRKPFWISKIPQDKTYFYAVGVGTGKRSLEEAKESATKSALAEIANYFGCVSQAKYEEKKTEKSIQYLDEIKTESAAINIEKASVEDWYFEKRRDGGYDAFVLVRYPYEELERQKDLQQREISEKLILAHESINRAREAIDNGAFIEALHYDADSLRILSDIGSEGHVLYLQARKELTGLISGLKVAKVSGDKQKGSTLTGLPEPLVLEAKWAKNGGRPIPVRGLKIFFSFSNGGGSLCEEAITDQDGKAYCFISRLDRSSDVVRVQARLEDPITFSLQSLTESEASLYSEFANGNILDYQLTVAEPKIIERISINIAESNLGRPLDSSIMTSALCGALSRTGFLISTNPNDQTAFTVSGRIDTRPGSSNLGYVSSCIAFGYVEISSGGNILYHKEIENIKGFGENAESAGWNALRELTTGVVDEISKSFSSFIDHKTGEANREII